MVLEAFFYRIVRLLYIGAHQIGVSLGNSTSYGKGLHAINTISPVLEAGGYYEASAGLQLVSRPSIYSVDFRGGHSLFCQSFIKGSLQSDLANLCPQPENVEVGRIELRDVTFTYPGRKGCRPAIENFSIVLEEHKHVALVGCSGSGKSTCLQLIQRFFDQDSGSVEMYGMDIRSLNVNSVRSKLGVISQEPVLFSGTVAENIMYGANDRADVSQWRFSGIVQVGSNLGVSHSSLTMAFM